MSLRRRTACSLVAASLAVAACGLGTKQDQAEQIHATVAKAVTAKWGQGVVTYTFTPDPDSLPNLPEGAADAALGAAAARAMLAPSTLAVLVDFDFAAGDALVRAVPTTAAAPSPEAAAAVEAGIVPEPAPAPEAGPPEPRTIFKSDTIFVKRSKLREGERRAWAKLDFRDLPSDEVRPDAEDLEPQEVLLAATNTLNPAYLVPLAGGALAGSVKIVGTEVLELSGPDGVPVPVSTTRYDANTSIDRALTALDLEDEALETRQLVMRLLLGRVPDVRPATFWLDDGGRLRQARFEFAQFLSRRNQPRLEITVAVNHYGGPVEVPAPTADETVQVERYGRMLRAALPRPS